jgi:hypothetical protein
VTELSDTMKRRNDETDGQTSTFSALRRFFALGFEVDVFQPEVFIEIRRIKRVSQNTTMRHT